jgi:hypothetical protein
MPVDRSGSRHDEIFDALWIGDLDKFKLLLSSGGLDLDIAEVEEGLYEPLKLDRSILDAIHVEFGCRAIEETVLGAVDNPPIGDDPDVERVHGKLIEKDEPDQ